MDKLEARLRTVLIWSVRFSLLCFLCGLVLRLSGAPTEFPFHAGIVVLMLGPLGRVILSLVAFYKARDWPFLAATFGVVVVLLTTFYTAWSILRDGSSQVVAG